MGFINFDAPCPCAPAVAADKRVIATAIAKAVVMLNSLNDWLGIFIIVFFSDSVV